MTEFHLLSYPLTEAGPVWPGNPPAARCEPFESSARGDPANTTILHLFSHSGTHLDVPWHFNPAGPRATEMPLEAFVFLRPLVVDVPKPDGGVITPEDLQAWAARMEAADSVFLNTGWSRVRDADPERYSLSGPALQPDGARFLLDHAPHLKAVGIDAISIGSPGDLELTIATHRVLTGHGRQDGRFALIIEDMRIDADLDQAFRIYAWPLMVLEADSTPCTLVAEFL